MFDPMRFFVKSSWLFSLILGCAVFSEICLGAANSDFGKEIHLKIQSTSATYQGYGFDNAISTSPNLKYVAGIEGEIMSYIEFETDKPSDIEGMYIEWYSKFCFARTIEITLIDNNNRVIRNIKYNQKESDLDSMIRFEPALMCSKIRVVFSDFFGCNRLLLRKIRVFEQKTQQTDENAIFLSAKDEKNPLLPDRLAVSLKIKNLSDCLVKGLEHDHDKLMSFMNYMNTFACAIPSKFQLNTIVDEKKGICGHFADLLAGLCVCQGIKSRLIAINYYTQHQGHEVMEAFVNGKWRLYDPTYGGYYKLVNAQDGLPLGLEEIIKAYETEPESVEFMYTKERYGLKLYTGKDIYLNSAPIGAHGLDKVRFYPLELGAESSVDPTNKQEYIKHQGSHILGARSINTNHIWTLHNLLKGKRYEFIIWPKSLGREDSKKNVFVLKAAYLEEGGLKTLHHEFKFQNGTCEPWAITFTAESEKLELKLFHDYRGPDLFWMSMRKYELKEIKTEDVTSH